MTRPGRPVDRPFRRCRWCQRVMSQMAVPGEDRYERPHCDTSPQCNWGTDCWSKHLRLLEGA